MNCQTLFALELSSGGIALYVAAHLDEEPALVGKLAPVEMTALGGRLGPAGMAAFAQKLAPAEKPDLPHSPYS